MTNAHTLSASNNKTAHQEHPHRVEKPWQRKRKEGKLRVRAVQRRALSYPWSGKPTMPRICEASEDTEPKKTRQAQSASPQQDHDYYVDTQRHDTSLNDAFQRTSTFPAHRRNRIRRNSSRAKHNVWTRGETGELAELRKRHDELQVYIEKTKWDMGTRSVWTEKEAELERDLEAIRRGVDGVDLAGV